VAVVGAPQESVCEVHPFEFAGVTVCVVEIRTMGAFRKSRYEARSAIWPEMPDARNRLPAANDNAVSTRTSIKLVVSLLPDVRRVSRLLLRGRMSGLFI
jgi:hypothetical protein